MLKPTMGAEGTWKTHERPMPWDPAKALTFVDAYIRVGHFLKPGLPLSPEMVLLFFFHETAFSNIRQQSKATEKNPAGVGPGVGFGQLEIRNSDKPDFLRRVYNTNPDDSLFGKITADENYAIRMHCEYMNDKYARGATTVGALVNGQIGGQSQNAFMAEYFKLAEPKLKSAIRQNSRVGIIDALNSCRWYFDENDNMKKMNKTAVTDANKGKWFNPVPYQRFKRYWDFTLPS